jgi:3-oxoacyl-[acyl-carrier-protein] synthase-3
MKSKQKLYISDIAYTLGDAHSLNELKSDSKRDEIDFLLGAGLDKFRKSPKSNEELAYQAAARTLEKSDRDPGEIDALVFSTTILSLEGRPFYIREIDRILYDFNLKKAYPLGYFLSNCANLIGAIKFAASLIKSGDHQTILMVVSDKMANDERRFMGSNESILSDGAVGFILSASPGEFELLHLIQKIDPSYVSEKFNVTGYLKRSAAGIKNTFHELVTLDNSEISNYKKVFIGNYNLMVQRIYRNELGLTEKQMFLDNIPGIGHVFSADLLINFSDFLRRDTLKSGDLFGFIGIGPSRWEAFSIKKSEHHKEGGS